MRIALHVAALLAAAVLIASPAVAGEKRASDLFSEAAWQDEIVACGFRECTGFEPDQASADPPSCGESETNSRLIDARMRHGDAWAIEQLRSRMPHTVSLHERLRIAAALLYTSGDAEAWKVLMTDAEIAVRFPQSNDGSVTRELEEWCHERGLVDARDYHEDAFQAFRSVCADKRSHALLLRALDTSDEHLIYTAIWGLGKQHDEAALPRIRETLDRLVANGADRGLAFALHTFRSDAADALAMEYLEQKEWSNYRAVRSHPFD